MKSDLTYKAKRKLVKELMYEYKLAKGKYEVLQDRNYYPSVELNKVKEKGEVYGRVEIRILNQMEKIEDQLVVITYFESILNKLDPSHREILLNDYIHKKVGWWDEFYSKSTYYRTKRLAIDEFLDYVLNG